MSLLGAPPEILEIVLKKLDGTSLVRLWLTGSFTLHHTIRNRGALRSALLVLPHDSFGPSRLPQMLHSCSSLSSLTISADGARIATPERMWSVLSSLSSLRKLRLICLIAEEWMIEYDENIETLFDESPSLPPPDTPIAHLPSTEYELRPIAATFPHLESLFLKTKRQFLRPHHICHLPKSLTSIKLPDHKSVNYTCLPYFNDFPNIRTILLDVPKEPKEPLSGVLPPTVTKLTLSDAYLKIPAEFWGSQSQLISFTGNLHTELSIASLPPSLEKLTFPYIIEQEARYYRYDHLPRLRCLRFQGSHYENREDNILPALPPTLENFQLQNATDSTPFDLPPSMRTIYISSLNEYETSVLDLFLRLPALTSLHIAYVDLSFNEEFMRALPTGLTFLQISHKPWGKRFRPKLVNLSPIALDLPRGLSSLLLSENIFCLTSSGFKDLPRHLTDLDIGIVFHGNYRDIGEHISQLPRTLVTVRFEHVELIGVDANLIGTHHLRPAETRWDVGMLNNLPHASLTDLRIEQANAAIWTEEMANCLGPNLKRFSLYGGVFKESAVLHLPRTLKSLTIGNQELPAIRFKDLPRNLRELSLPQFCDVHEWDLVDLPPGLTKLLLSETDLYYLLPSSFNLLPLSISNVSYGPLLIGFHNQQHRINNEPLQDPCRRKTWQD